jgi:hypothetical protein
VRRRGRSCRGWRGRADGRVRTGILRLTRSALRKLICLAFQPFSSVSPPASQSGGIPSIAGFTAQSSGFTAPVCCPGLSPPARPRQPETTVSHPPLTVVSVWRSPVVRSHGTPETPETARQAYGTQGCPFDRPMPFGATGGPLMHSTGPAATPGKTDRHMESQQGGVPGGRQLLFATPPGPPGERQGATDRPGGRRGVTGSKGQYRPDGFRGEEPSPCSADVLAVLDAEMPDESPYRLRRD